MSVSRFPTTDDNIRAALAHLAEGGTVVVADDKDRENEGDLVCAAKHMTDETMVFFLRHGSGIVCTPMSNERATQLDLPLMVEDNTESHCTAFTVTVDHTDVSTGISATDRAITVRALGSAATRPEHLRRPGHVFPLRAQAGGVLKRAGHTEAATDLLAMAGLGDVAAITELVDTDGVPMAGRRLIEFAAEHGLPYLDIVDLVRYRRRTDQLIERTGEARMPTDHGLFNAVCFRSVHDGIEHVALTMGDLAAANASEAGTLVRVHSECLTGDLFGSQRCDCGSQMQAALRTIAEEGTGAVIYLRGHEGRGIGLGHKLQAYQLQDRGRDTVDANVDLGLPVDDRDYGVGAAILTDLGVNRVRLITNNPHKYSGLGGYDLELVDRVASRPSVTPENIGYLRTKRDRLGHVIDLPPVALA
jgi:3,4-dihydroxy 2-butanone 4-phosphate synthase/GTP cyclohydrolase II